MTRMFLLLASIGVLIAAARAATRRVRSFQNGTAGGSAHRHKQGAPGRTRSQLSVDEACAILGLQREASRAEIVAAHRRLVQKLHPDTGGSEYLASQINCARDVLLERL